MSVTSVPDIPARPAAPPRGSLSSRLVGPALLTPAAALVVLLVVAPLLLVMRNSVAFGDPYGGIRGGFTFDNFRALADPVYRHVLYYSLRVAAVNTVVCLVAGYIISYYVVSRPPQRQVLILLMIVVPFWTDFLVRTFALINVLSADGPVSTVTNHLGMTHRGLHLVPSQPATYLGLLYAFLPTAVFPIYASLRGVDFTLTEAARDLGCGWWRVHTRVLLPLARPGLLGAAPLVFIPTLGVFVIPVLLGGGKQELLGNLILTLYTEFRNQPMGAAASVVLLVLMIAAAAIVALANRRLRTRS